jgi:hypothetical protein
MGLQKLPNRRASESRLIPAEAACLRVAFSGWPHFSLTPARANANWRFTDDQGGLTDFPIGRCCPVSQPAKLLTAPCPLLQAPIPNQ